MLTDEKQQYILAHLNDRPRREVIRKAGVSQSTFYDYVRKLGGEMRYDLATRNTEWEAIVREHYATMSGYEIERKFGITRGRANKIAHELGLRHSPECEERMKREADERRRILCHTKECRAKAARKWRINRRRDEMRAWVGEPQRTNHRIATITRKACQAKSYLAIKYNYIVCDNEPYSLYYDNDTKRVGSRRSEKPEGYYETKYHFKFKELCKD